MRRSQSAMTAEDLQAWRDKHKLSLTVGAEWLGVSRSMFQSYVTGRYSIPATVLLLTQAIDMLSDRQRKAYDQLTIVSPQGADISD